MLYSVHHILAAIALVLAVFGLIWPNYPLTTVAVVLLAVAAFV